ncbi:MAG TPA: methionine--tRNA ligase [Rhodospirillaceae bacterium]|jgi:methionyl-tRNA synthetase|nr:methionine--tRNA ligase [Alphaproteobacteria bacterium]HBH25959.1 methionine--tRNA ligase [Rhodospirillaceae bacterium]
MFTLTTAISYVNGAPHLGHAYEAILADAVARFRRLEGRRVLFIGGTDEHGEKVASTARAQGAEVQAFAGHNAAAFQAMGQDLGISHDAFIRTTQERHKAAAQALWARLAEAGAIYLGKYEGWYSVREEAYFTESELLTDPATGERFTPGGTEVKWVEEESYFFRLSAYTEDLLRLYDAHPRFLQPDARRNEVAAFVRGGLRDLSISRHKSRLDWGVPVPGDANHVMYVWVDALTNYLTGCGYPGDMGDRWPADVHVIGKDIIRFHAVYWPAFLMAAGLPLPRGIFAHGHLTIGGEKMSKSRGNVLTPGDLLAVYGRDPLRYLLLREVPHGQDGAVAHVHAVARLNADLANGVGNLAQRTLTLIHKNCGAAVPKPGALVPEDEALLHAARSDLLPTMAGPMEAFAVHRALEGVMDLAARADAYIDAMAPWVLRKTDPARMASVLYVLAEVIRCVAIALQCAMPGKAAEMLEQLAVPPGARDFAALTQSPLQPGTPLPPPQGLFPRLTAPEQSA